MLGNDFEHQLIRKYVAVFGTIFNDINITRQKGDEVAHKFNVPIMYGPREKYLAMIKQKPDDKVWATILPRMSFQIMGMEYDVERKFLRNNEFRSSNHRIYEAKPWNIHFQLSVLTKTEMDATKIVEQILYYFDPDLTVAVQLVENVDRSWDIPINLMGITNDEIYEGNFEERRMIMWTLDFTMKAWIIGPVNEAKVIKFMTINTIPSEDITDVTTIRPGLTKDGKPTTNENESIHYLDINAWDDYAIIEKHEEIFKHE